MHVFRIVTAFVCVLLAAGCGPKNPPAPTESAGGHGHEHTPPHGGTPVVLGDEAFHIELVRDANAGKLTAYILDGHMGAFIRIPAMGFPITAQFAGRTETLQFTAVANPATGEKPGDTSQFESSAEWIKTTSAFAGELPELAIRGQTFKQVKFKFPEGNEPGHEGHKH